MRRWLVAGWIMAGIVLVAGSAATEKILPADGGAEIPAPRYVALTFDDGPRPGSTEKLLEGLRDRGVQATFFLIGEQAELYPELVQMIGAEGHQVGNHTWGHVCLQDLNTAEALAEVERSDAVLQKILGPGEYWVRPPYGLVDQVFMRQLSVPVIKWSVDPRDWESRNTQAVVDAVMKTVTDGSIVLLHDIYETSVEAAFQIIYLLEPQGYRFVTVEQLLRIKGIEPQAGIAYRYA